MVSSSVFGFAAFSRLHLQVELQAQLMHCLSSQMVIHVRIVMIFIEAGADSYAYIK